jgi:putative peptidoglycan lipid II flippase
LTSHRKMAMAYLAPVMWNLAMIGAFLWFGRRLAIVPLVTTVAWASVIGAALQVGFQLPAVLASVKRLKLRFDTKRDSVRRVLRNLGPVALSRGAVQISQFVDLTIANHLPNGSASLLASAQTITMLPISLFGIAVSAAELPEMSSVTGSETERLDKLRDRLTAGVRRIAFFVIPSAVAFVVLGDVIVRVLYEGRRFTPLDTRFTWGILAASAFGLLASTMGRLYSSAYYAMHDTRSPFRIALVRICISIALGYTLAIVVTRALGFDQRWGTAALSLSAGTAGWVEFALLRRGLRKRIGSMSMPVGFVAKVWALAIAAAVLGRLTFEGVNRWTSFSSTGVEFIVEAVAALGMYGAAYLAGAAMLRIPESEALTRRLIRR